MKEKLGWALVEKKERSRDASHSDDIDKNVYHKHFTECLVFIETVKKDDDQTMDCWECTKWRMSSWDYKNSKFWYPLRNMEQRK